MHFKLFLISAATMVNAAHVELGTAADFAILAKAGITNVGFSLITGDIAVSPIAGTSMTGFDLSPLVTDGHKKSTTTPVIQVSGDVFAPEYAPLTAVKLTRAVSDMLIAYHYAAAVPVTPIDPTKKEYFYINHGKPRTVDVNGKEQTPAGVPGKLGGLTLTAGVYEFGVEVTIDNHLTFKGSNTDIFIIKTSKSVTQADDTHVKLENMSGGFGAANGPQAENIFWQVAETVKVGDSAKMKGTLLVWTSVEFIANSQLEGRILAGTAVTLDKNTIDASTLSTPAHRGLRGLHVA